MPSWVAGARTATWSGTIRLFRLGSQLANEAGGRRQERERSRTGADDNPSPGRDTSDRVLFATRALSGVVAGDSRTRSRPTSSATPSPAATARKPQRPERSVSCSSARSCSTVESEAGSSWLALDRKSVVEGKGVETRGGTVNK